ncbi:MAG: urease accessory protein UreD [Panacagrimonas sp.]
MEFDLSLSSRDPRAQHHSPRAWHGELTGTLDLRQQRTIMVHKRHIGPLRIQKLLYPESPRRADVLLLHPPTGIASGDQLTMDFRLRSGSAARFTTPGASKWYRSCGPQARQTIRLRVDAGASLEWLPQEAIVFDGAELKSETVIDCADGAAAFGWDIWMLGRRHSGERFGHGRLGLRSTLRRDGQILWSERTALNAGAGILAAPQGWNDCSVSGNAWALGLPNDESLIDACRQIRVDGVHLGITRFEHGLCLVRALGQSAARVRTGLTLVWQRIRPALIGADAVPPRIWAT